MKFEELPLTEAEVIKLKQLCLEARSLSYSPYSKFRVGCTLVTSEGEFISGANIENASYGGSICAERSTICKAVNERKYKFKVIAISSDSQEAISPCGICRQFIREFGKEIPILMFGQEGNTHELMNLEELLPKSFGPSWLGVPEA
ncbi:cytidine deaminase [Yamadazyma tenuis]|uniref:Cytidine deaminase n=1 Tax=Candida tenuis (strain ATCC 10573 / BCRC 21748 / CBS 615 / JCM 9827 / NBRC 10315 / NRRL Y-1498 / VKM Y-70) TaxID=590646 RepID=G3B9E7_CANTC|nr:cytidine deaminase [Yamadazyma tenuis ATCC 10573]EGV61868.1 cytidine deaminase [Yamadazyma tenuis ATCC 10573]WEJ93097.1 cytidine deaminase [Yamadazyma tenuis]